MARLEDFILDDGDTEEIHQKKTRILQRYRTAVRREWFRRQGALKRLLREAGAGDFPTALKPVENIAGSSGVARPPLRGNTSSPLTGSPVASPLTESITNFGRKAMPERDDENKAQSDQLRSSSGADTFDGYDLPTSGQASPAQASSCEPPARSNPILP